MDIVPSKRRWDRTVKFQGQAPQNLDKVRPKNYRKYLKVRQAHKILLMSRLRGRVRRQIQIQFQHHSQFKFQMSDSACIGMLIASLMKC